MPKHRVRIRNQQHAVLGGLALMAAGAYLLYDAYEGRGKDRPFLMKFLTPS